MTHLHSYELPVAGEQPARRIAYRHTPGTGPTFVFLPGYMSDMQGGKATALFEWAQANGRACLLMDYSGCGASSGYFADGSLGLWRDEVLALIEAVTDGPVCLIGSSMGGWLMLLIGERLGAERLAGMIGIAAAPDFSEWGFNAAQQGKLAAGKTVYERNPYGPEPTPTHAKFWQDAQANRMLDRAIKITCPVHLLHGQRDEDVPWETSLRLAEALRSDAVKVTLVKDADHRMSRDADIALLLRTVAISAEIEQ